MNKEHSVIQVVAKRFQAGASDDICVLHPPDPYFFHIPGDPFHLLASAIQVDDNGDALFKRPVYLFQITVSGTSYHESLNCELDSLVRHEGCEQTFRHIGYKLQGLTDYLLSDRAATPINHVRFCAVIETVGFEHPEAGWVTETAYKGWLNTRDTEDLVKACSPIPPQFEINP